MYIQEGGNPYSFCPGKSQWDPRVAERLRLLMLCAETGNMLVPGGVHDQPDWFIDLLAWFIPVYKQTVVLMYAKMFLGKSKEETGGKSALKGSQPRPTKG